MEESNEVIIVKNGSISKIGNSVALILPKAIVELIGSITKKNLYDRSKKFRANIKIQRNGDLLITKIDESVIEKKAKK